MPKQSKELKNILKFYGKKENYVNRTIFKLKFIFRFFVAKITPFCPIISIRAKLARFRGVNIGRNVYLGHKVEFDYIFPSKITIGDNSGIGDGVYISAHHSIATDTPIAKIYPREVNPVRIGKGVDINLNVIIQPGVTIGDYAVIGNAAVVTKDIPPMTFAVGVPAKVIKDLSIKLKPYISIDEYKKLLAIRQKIFHYEEGNIDD